MNQSIIKSLSRDDMIDVIERIYDILGYEYDFYSAQNFTDEDIRNDLSKCIKLVGYQVYLDVYMNMLQSRLDR